jgi:hypothetical protein
MLMSGANLQMKDMLPNPCPPAMKFGQHLCGDEQILLIENVRIRMAEARRRRAGVEQKFSRILCVTESLSPSHEREKYR